MDMKPGRAISMVMAVLAAVMAAPAQTAAPSPAAPAASPEPAGADDLFQLGRQWFDAYASPEIKAQFEFPTKEKWDAFGLRLQRALESDSLADLAVYLPEARLTLTALRAVPGYEDYADWLEQRIDEIEAAEEITKSTPPPVPAPPGPRPSAPTPPPKAGPVPRPSTAVSARVPHYDLWVARVSGRALPERAAALMPGLRAAFVAEGVPAELAWLAEAESSLNPAARSPSGAKGLFQFMPETAQSLGLSTFLPDERTNPEKSGHAAARYLRTLHARFGDWPLALAAYNAGEGRVSRALTKKGVKDFAGVAAALPAETRMYVPKVYALVALRAGVSPEKIVAPRKP